MEKTGRPRWLPARRLLAGAAALTGGLLATGVLFAGVASAHVKVSGTDAVQGGSGVITFRVPSESATASTTGLLITFPAATPFTSVDVQPKAGWTATVTRKPLPHPLKDDDGDTISDYVAQVTYKATSAGAIPPGEFDMFNLSVGPFPTASSMSFAALQTYSDGTTVNWDEASANGTEPEHPSPVLQLAAAAGTTASSGGTAQPGVAVTASPVAAAPAPAGSSPSWPGIAGLIAGLLALVVSVAVLLGNRARGKAAPSA
jgi:uncharacterized protein